jgi:nucleoside-diphosphate-sugar epimerase
LIKKLAIAQGVKARLVPIPVSWMRLAARLLGKLDVAERLFGSLQIDSRKARDLLGWTPAVTMDEQLRKMFGR